MAFTLKKMASKVLKYTSISVISLLLFLFIVPYFFPETVATKIKNIANKNLKGEINFTKARLSFFNHFPSLTLTLYNVQVNGSAPFSKDTLLAAKEVAFGINMPSLFSKKININEVYITESLINILVDSTGNANYNVYQADTKKTTSTNDTTAALKIEKIIIEKSHLMYKDASLPMYINARAFEYKGTGDLSKAIFDLTTHAEIAAIDFEYGNKSYFIAKKLTADLVTKINTNSLALVFEKNDLKINKLPLNFKGTFEFLKDGYNMDFKLNSNATDLKNLVTALPPEYLQWLEKTEVKGTADIQAALVGKYSAINNQMPSFSINTNIREGFIANDKTPNPIQNLFLNLTASLPSLNTDSLFIKVDSVFFNIGKDYLSSVIELKGLKTPNIIAKLNADIDVEKWDKALGIPLFDAKGILKINATANGKYATAIVPNGLRKMDTIISSIPKFNIEASVSNGYFKYASLPKAITNISFNAKAICTDSVYKHTNIAIEKININVLANYIKGYVKLNGLENYPMDINLQALFNLADIKAVFPLDSIDIKGNLNANITSIGKLNISKKMFPIISANVSVNNASIKTKYYPNAINKINVQTLITNNRSGLQGVSINVNPASFQLEGQPFAITANLKNLENIQYQITSKGVLDIGKIYKVFAVEGISTKGFIETNIKLKGNQADAMAGRLSKLQNSGILKVKDIAVSYDIFPTPFYINKGVFSFKNDKLWFDAFKATYGSSSLQMDGYLSNIINYATQKKATLNGNFNFKSPYLFVDEFMAYSTLKTNSNKASTGVVLLPNNLNITLNAQVDKVNYQGLILQKVNGVVAIDKGVLSNQIAFGIVDANATMQANYTSVSPTKATFSYTIKADSFSIQKAYNQIKLFKDLASSAKYANGLVGIEYTISGLLNKNMMPIYPSLTGGGKLSMQDVKVKGMKLWTAVSKATERDSVSNPNIKKVVMKSTIKNNIITIERTKMRILGFRPRIEGQVNFNGQYNLKMRLGLPPLGIFGIPMVITGSGANPKVKLGKGKKEDELAEEKENEL